MRNNKGSRTLPCGMAGVTPRKSEWKVPEDVYCRLSVMNLRIHKSVRESRFKGQLS